MYLVDEELKMDFLVSLTNSSHLQKKLNNIFKKKILISLFHSVASKRVLWLVIKANFKY